MCKLIVADPEKRLSAKQALQEAWFSKVITRDSVSQLKDARFSFKERRIRKSLGIQEQFERLPISAIREAELLRSGLDMSSEYEIKRSYSVSGPINHFSFTQGGRIRVHNNQNSDERHEHARDSCSNSHSMPFDPISPTKFDNSWAGLPQRNEMTPFTDHVEMNKILLGPNSVVKKPNEEAEKRLIDEENKSQENLFNSKGSYTSPLRINEGRLVSEEKIKEIEVDQVDPCEDFTATSNSEQRKNEKMMGIGSKTRDNSFRSAK